MHQMVVLATLKTAWGIRAIKLPSPSNLSVFFPFYNISIASWVVKNHIFFNSLLVNVFIKSVPPKAQSIIIKMDLVVEKIDNHAIIILKC